VSLNNLSYTHAMFLRKERVRVRLFKSISTHREQRVYARQSDRGKHFAHARIIRLGALSSEDDAIYRNRPRRDCSMGRTSMNELIATPFVSP